MLWGNLSRSKQVLGFLRGFGCLGTLVWFCLLFLSPPLQARRPRVAVQKGFPSQRPQRRCAAVAQAAAVPGWSPGAARRARAPGSSRWEPRSPRAPQQPVRPHPKMAGGARRGPLPAPVPAARAAAQARSGGRQPWRRGAGSGRPSSTATWRRWAPSAAGCWTAGPTTCTWM